jgi:hypothetical protein
MTAPVGNEGGQFCTVMAAIFVTLLLMIPPGMFTQPLLLVTVWAPVVHIAFVHNVTVVSPTHEMSLVLQAQAEQLRVSA